MSWWHIPPASVLWILRCIQQSAPTHTRAATRPGRPESFLPSPPITCTTPRTALCTGGPLPASPLSEPCPLRSAPERPLQALRALASTPRFSPARTPCPPSLLPSTIQTSTLLYPPRRLPYPQNSSRLLRSHVWRVRFLSLSLSLCSPPTFYTLSLFCLTSCLHVCLSVSLFCLSVSVSVLGSGHGGSHTFATFLTPGGFCRFERTG